MERSIGATPMGAPDPRRGRVADTAEPYETVVAVFDRPEQVETARNLLLAQGLDARQIRVIDRDMVRTDNAAGAEEKSAAAAGAAAGTAIGATFGPFFPIGTIVGGLLGWLGGLGIPEEHATHYDRAVDAGSPLVVVRVPPGQTAAAWAVLAQAGARSAPSTARDPGRTDNPLVGQTPLGAHGPEHVGPRHPEIIPEQSGQPGTLEPRRDVKDAR